MEVTAIMRKNMSVCDLKRYYEGRSPKRILFCVENQVWDTVENPLKASLSFSSMAIAHNPNVISLKSGENTLWFERIKRIVVDTGRSPLGVVLEIVCGDSAAKENDIRYTLITT